MILAPTTGSGGAGPTMLGLPGDPEALEGSARCFVGASGATTVVRLGRIAPHCRPGSLSRAGPARLVLL